MSLDSKWILVLGNMLIQTLPTTLGDEPTAKNTAFTEAFALSRLELISCLDLLFVAQSEEFEDVDLSETFEYEKRKAGWTVSKWESQGHVFILTAKASQEKMESMLAEYTP